MFTPCLEGMKHVKSEHGEMLTKPFLELCKTILPVIGNKGRNFLCYSFVCLNTFELSLTFFRDCSLCFNTIRSCISCGFPLFL